MAGSGEATWLNDDEVAWLAMAHGALDLDGGCPG
jgi:hypothetical protein